MSYQTHLAEHERLTILRLLNEMPTCSANSSVLCDGMAAYGIPTTRDSTRSAIAWLAEQRLVTTAEPREGLLIATATERGLDVATGRARVPGVARPTPRG